MEEGKTLNQQERFQLALLQHSLYYSGLEWNPQYLTRYACIHSFSHDKKIYAEREIKMTHIEKKVCYSVCSINALW